MYEFIIQILKIATAIVIPVVFVVLFVGSVVLLMVLSKKLYTCIIGIKTDHARQSEALEQIRKDYDEILSKCSADMEFFYISDSYKNILIRKIEVLVDERKAGRITSEDFTTRAVSALTEYENNYKKFKIHYDSTHKNNCPCQK